MTENFGNESKGPEKAPLGVHSRWFAIVAVEDEDIGFNRHAFLGHPHEEPDAGTSEKLASFVFVPVGVCRYWHFVAVLLLNPASQVSSVRWGRRLPLVFESVVGGYGHRAFLHSLPDSVLRLMNVRAEYLNDSSREVVFLQRTFDVALHEHQRVWLIIEYQKSARLHKV